MPHLDEVKHDAESIGAVNTVLILIDEKFGYNTDWKGIYRPLEGVTGKSRYFGSRWSSCSSSVCCFHARIYPVILNRSPERAIHLARKTGAETGMLEDIGKFSPDLIINTLLSVWERSEFQFLHRH